MGVMLVTAIKNRFALGPIKRATYRAANFRNLPTTWFVARHVCTWQVKHATSIASQLVLLQCWKNVARFCCTFYRTFNNRTKTATKCIAVKLLRTCGPARSFPLPTIPIKHLIAGYQTWETWFHDLIYQKIWRRRPYYHTVARVIISFFVLFEADTGEHNIVKLVSFEDPSPFSFLSQSFISEFTR